MAVKVCPGCGEGNKETAHVCVVCSSSLRDVVPQGTLNSDKKYSGSLSKSSVCSHCHESLEEGALKCKYCGTLVSRISSPQPYYQYDEDLTPTPDNVAMTLIVISTIVIPIVGLIVGGVVSFSDDRDKQDTGKMLLILGLVMIVVQLFLFWWIFA
ncbi:zinc ribbon domain-containing protein [Paenibacillus sp. N3/727]|uniref:double zinc ribbon domain-containing protein n=1 Tax=Paenibacillus sp. N3/727 TaxID=2925845 RepID=UPI001F52EFD6|nr:zinc ribbon domain-containing protein [Paenibacillus sp. N3/727]UNK16888.1 zinc ribbon domain-containing protein [Paenibacillus sp. N3/727]